MAVNFSHVFAGECARPRHEHRQNIVQGFAVLIQHPAPVHEPGAEIFKTRRQRQEYVRQQCFALRTGETYDADAPGSRRRRYGGDGGHGRHELLVLRTAGRAVHAPPAGKKACLEPARFQSHGLRLREKTLFFRGGTPPGLLDAMLSAA